MNIDRAPKGVLRAFYRFPIYLYKAGLGWLLGGRVLMLTHTGRKSGLPRYVVLEVVEHRQGEWFVAAAYGERADWYRNVRVNPNVTIDFRGRKTPAVAEVVPVSQGAAVLSDYALRHPKAARQLGKMMHLPIDQDAGAAAEKIPIVRLTAAGDTTS